MITDKIALMRSVIYLAAHDEMAKEAQNVKEGSDNLKATYAEITYRVIPSVDQNESKPTR